MEHTASGQYENYDFRDLAHTSEEYFYDANGNMTRDDNKGIADIQYNELNLPVKVVVAGRAIHKSNSILMQTILQIKLLSETR